MRKFVVRGGHRGISECDSRLQSPAGVTNISKMTDEILVKNGIAETCNLRARLDIGNAGSVGIANLVDNTLKLHVTAVLARSISQTVGGNNIGSFMQTALANKQGELAVPVLVSRTFSNPTFAPDIQQIARMKVKGLVPNFDDPASITGTLQALLGEPGNFGLHSQSPEKQQTQEPNPAQQLIESFRKQEKAQSTAAKRRGRFSATWRWSCKRDRQLRPALLRRRMSSTEAVDD